MNKNIIYIIIAIFGVILVFNACNKDMKTNPNNTNEIYWTAEDLKIQNSIINFQNKIFNNTYKSGEELTLDSAIWYLEAMINFNYSTIDSNYVNLTIDTTFEFDLPVNNDMVNYDDVTEASFAMEEHILNFLEQIPDDIKFMIVGDVRIKNDDFKNGTTTITVSTGYGSSYLPGPGWYNPFGPDDYWKYGEGPNNMGGYCAGPNQGQQTDSDAAMQMASRINNPNIVTPPCYFTNIEQPLVIVNNYPNPNDPNPGDNYIEYLSLWADGYYECLNPEEMNVYLYGNLDIIEAERLILVANTGLNYEFAFTVMEGQFYMGGLTCIQPKPRYGIRHYYISPK